MKEKLGRKREFVIVAQQRSGTHLLLSLLNSHSQIAGLGEVLHNKESSYNFYPFWAKVVASDPEAIRPKRSGRVWRAFVSELHETLGASRLAMIAMYNQLAGLPARLRRVILFDQPAIHLIRLNVLRTHILGPRKSHAPGAGTHAQRRDAREGRASSGQLARATPRAKGGNSLDAGAFAGP